jgi:hypothetical protein
MQGNNSGVQQVQLTVGEFKTKIRDKKDLYESMLRNGWYLPKYKCSLLTETYMIGVLEKELWCPKHEDIRRLPCPRLPQKDVLFEKFNAIMTANRIKNHGVTMTRSPDKGWLVDIISSFNPGDAMFKKGYLPPKRDSALAQIKSIPVSEVFFEGLPSSQSKVKRSRLKIISKGSKNAKRVYTEQRIVDLNKQLYELKVQQDEVKERHRMLLQQHLDPQLVVADLP